MAMTARLRRSVTVWLVGGLALAGCSSTPEPLIGPAASRPVPELGQANYSVVRPSVYYIRPSDQIAVIVFREPDLSAQSVRVGVEGNVSLPMIGSIPAAGKTAKQLEQDVALRLAAAGVKNPMVSINVSEYASHLVTVEGSVQEPGVFIFQPGARLSSAIAMAKGPTRVAKRSQVAVFRESSDGVMVAKFDYGQVVQGTMLDPVLEPGDRVVVGTSGLSQFWQDLLQTIPVFGVFVGAALR